MAGPTNCNQRAAYVLGMAMTSFRGNFFGGGARIDQSLMYLAHCQVMGCQAIFLCYFRILDYRCCCSSWSRTASLDSVQTASFKEQIQH